MNSENKFWHINDFTKLLNEQYSLMTNKESTIHVNTVNNWFNALEEKNIHYVPKIDDMRIYEELDLKVALFMLDKRKNKWNLEAIYNILPENVELRPIQAFETKKDSSMNHYQDSKIPELIQNRLVFIEKYIDASSTIHNSKIRLELEINTIENEISNLESEIRNTERNIRYITLLELKSQNQEVVKTKNKGFFGKLFGSSESEIREDLPNENLKKAANEEADELRRDLQNLEKQKDECMNKLSSKLHDYEELSKSINYKHPITVEEAQELLKLDYEEYKEEKANEHT